MFDLDKLKNFCAVYRHRSILLASRELYLTSAAVSISIKTLEREINRPLFHRIGKTFVPTAFAEKLNSLATGFLGELNGLMTDRPGTEPHGEVCVGALPGFGATTLVELAARYRERCPKVSLKIRTGPVASLVGLLAAGDIAFAFVARGVPLGPHPPLEIQDLEGGYALKMVCSRTYFRQWFDEKPTLRKLATANHIALQDMPTRLREWYRLNYKNALRPTIGLTFDNIFGAIAAVKSDLGVALLPSDVISADVESGALIEFGTPLTGTGFRYQLLRPRDRVCTVAESSVLEFIATASPGSRR